eukprot:gene27384-35367_t
MAGEHPEGGPEGRRALDCDHIIRQALDAAKTGVRVPYRADLLKVDKPHYMKRSGASHSGKYRKSRSILGKLFDMTTEAMEAVSGFYNTSGELELDEDLLCIDGFEVRNREDVVLPYADRWSGYYDLYKRSLAMIIENGVRETEERVRLRAELLREHYVALFEYEAESIHREYSASGGRHLSTALPHQTSNNTGVTAAEAILREDVDPTNLIAGRGAERDSHATINLLVDSIGDLETARFRLA